MNTDMSESDMNELTEKVIRCFGKPKLELRRMANRC